MKINILCYFLLAMTFGRITCHSLSGLPSLSISEKVSAKLAPAYSGVLVITKKGAEFHECKTQMNLKIVDESGQLDSCYQHTLAGNYNVVYATLHGNIDLAEMTDKHAGTFFVTYIRQLEHTTGSSDCWQ